MCFNFMSKGKTGKGNRAIAFLAIAAYIVLVAFISIKRAPEREAGLAQQEAERNGETTASSQETDKEKIALPDGAIDLLTDDYYSSAAITGQQANPDAAWNSNIALLGSDQDEQGLFMMPGTTITMTVDVPENGKINITDKLNATAASWNVSDGADLIIEVVKGDQSLKTFDKVDVKSDGSENTAVLDLSEYSSQIIDLKISCYDGGQDNSNGDWVMISKLYLSGDVSTSSIQPLIPDSAVNLLADEQFNGASIDGQQESDDTPWKTNITMLGASDSEQGLIMLPGTSITYTLSVPVDGRLNISYKLFEQAAEWGVSDGAELTVEILKNDEVVDIVTDMLVKPDGSRSTEIVNLKDYSGKDIKVRISCSDGGNGQIDGDWVLLKEMYVYSEE